MHFEDEMGDFASKLSKREFGNLRVSEMCFSAVLFAIEIQYSCFSLWEEVHN